MSQPKQRKASLPEPKQRKSAVVSASAPTKSLKARPVQSVERDEDFREDPTSGPDSDSDSDTPLKDLLSELDTNLGVLDDAIDGLFADLQPYVAEVHFIPQDEGDVEKVDTLSLRSVHASPTLNAVSLANAGVERLLARVHWIRGQIQH